MQVKVTYSSDTEATMSVIAAENELRAIKEHVLSHFQDTVKVPGFRQGKVPAAVLEKHVDPTSLQTRFLEEALEQLYTQAVRSQKLRPVDSPQANLKKFVPYSTLEFEATIPVVGKIKLADYTKIKLAKPKATVTAADIDQVVTSLRERLAEKKDVDRPAKAGDQVWIDFKGTDSKGAPVNGAEGKDYPLVLGSNKFIPGFEDNLIGLKANEEKTFTLKFPADYGVKTLANKNVTFQVIVTKVQQVILPKADNEFVTKVGPFKTMAELKTDIKKQLTIEKQQAADRSYESEIITAVTAKSSMAIPKVLVDSQLQRMEQDERQNLTYRGQTWEEHLKEEGLTADEHREKKRPEAEQNVKASLVLAEIAEAERLDVTPEELEIRIQLLKGQYQDPQMQAELDKPENRRDIAGRILTEKTLAKLVSHASAK